MLAGSSAARAGFSLVEALVVLAITSVLLVLVFSVTAGARKAGFAIARRADAHSDEAIGAESVRILLRGVRLPQRGRWTADFEGAPDAVTAQFVPMRTLACPVAAGALSRLRIESAEGRSRLLCETLNGRSGVLLDLGRGPAKFSFALAGRPWTDRLSARLPPPSVQGPAAPPTLWIRLTTGEGREILEAVDTPPIPAGRSG